MRPQEKPPPLPTYWVTVLLTILGPFWDHFGPFWYQVKTILGPFLDEFGVDRKPSRTSEAQLPSILDTQVLGSLVQHGSGLLNLVWDRVPFLVGTISLHLEVYK